MEQLAWQKRVHQLRMLLYKQPNLVIHLSFKIAVWICKEKTEKRKRQHCWCFLNFSHIVISYSCVLCVLHSSFIFWYSLCSLPTTYVNSCKCDLQLLFEFEKKKKKKNRHGWGFFNFHHILSLSGENGQMPFSKKKRKVFYPISQTN